MFLYVVGMLFAGGGTEKTTSVLPTTGNFSLGTGGQTGIYYPFGGAIAELWSKNIEGVNVKAEVTAASVENTIKVAAGTMIAGFAQANVVEQAYRGTGKFKEKLPVRVLISLYPNLLHVLLPQKTSIRGLKDIRGKRVSLGAPASGTAVTAENILKANGLTTDDFNARYLNYSETTNAIANGQIDVGFIVGGLGVGAVTELALTKDIIILSLKDEEINNFLKAQKSYNIVNVPAGVYKGVPAFRTVAIWNTLVVRKDLDENFAYQMTKVIYENYDYLTKVVTSARYTVPKNAQVVGTVPMHPGSMRYLNEVQK